MTGRRSVLWSFNYAIEGVVWALRTQRNMRVHVTAAIAVLVACIMLGIRGVPLGLVVFAISLVFATELINTAIEATVDLSTDHYEPLAKTAKDVAAGAVLVAALNALVVAYLVMFDPLVDVFARGLSTVAASPGELTVLALGLVLLVVLVLKALSREGTYLHGGWPSGHAALAFGAAAVIGFVTASGGAFILALGIAALVAQSRIEAGVHTVAQTVLGALIGLLLVTAVFQVFFA